MTPRKRETIVKHIKASSQVTVASIYTLALELSRQADGTIGPEFRENFDFSFDLLVEAQAKLADTQSQDEFQNTTGNSHSSRDDQIMAAISAAEASGGLTFGALVTATGIPKATLSRRLKELIEDNHVCLLSQTRTYKVVPKLEESSNNISEQRGT